MHKQILQGCFEWSSDVPFTAHQMNLTVLLSGKFYVSHKVRKEFFVSWLIWAGLLFHLISFFLFILPGFERYPIQSGSTIDFHGSTADSGAGRHNYFTGDQRNKANGYYWWCGSIRGKQFCMAPFPVDDLFSEGDEMEIATGYSTNSTAKEKFGLSDRVVWPLNWWIFVWFSYQRGVCLILNGQYNPCYYGL